MEKVVRTVTNIYRRANAMKIDWWHGTLQENWWERVSLENVPIHIGTENAANNRILRTLERKKEEDCFLAYLYQLQLVQPITRVLPVIDRRLVGGKL